MAMLVSARRWPVSIRIDTSGELIDGRCASTTEIADSVICCVPGEDRTNGFFVSCFIRGQTDASRGKKRARQVDHEADEEATEPKKSKAEEQAVVTAHPTSLEGTMTVEKDEPATEAKPKDAVSSSNKKPKKKKAKKSALRASA